MNINKKLKHFKLLIPSPAFRDQINNSDAGSSVLHARLVHSWLAYRSVHNFGASTRSICAEVGLHPNTVKHAISSLGGLVMRRGQEWVAIEPTDGLLITRQSDKPAKHWTDHLAYSILYLPRKGAKIKYPETSIRFGLNHAIIWSYLLRKSEKDNGVVRRFTMAGAAKMFDVDPKTVRSVINDLVWLKLIERIDLGGCSEIRPHPITDQHLNLFEIKVEPVSKSVEPVERKARSSITKFKFLGNPWDDCRRACEGLMVQTMAEEILIQSQRLGESPEGFLNEFQRVKAIHDDRVVKGKVAAGTFGGYLGGSYQKRIAILDEQERQLRHEQLLSSPEFQKMLADKRKAAESDPLDDNFILTDDAIFARVQFGSTVVNGIRALDSVNSKLYKAVRSHVAAKGVNPLHETAVIGDLKGKITKCALAVLNHHYKQPVLATQDEFERAIDDAITRIEPTMKQIFRQLA